MMPHRLLTATLLAALAACGGDKGSTAETAPAGGATAAPMPARGTAPARNWLNTVVKTPEGGFRVGNPDAPVKFLEFASLTCPACRAFHESAMPTLRRDYIATGRVSYELRNFVLNAPDLVATLVARCGGAGPYFKLVDDFYRTQPTWLKPFSEIPAAEQQRLAALAPADQPVALGDLGGIDDFMSLRGMPRARFEACLRDQRAIDELQAIRANAVERYQLQGTPTFVINGETQADLRSWPDVEQALKGALG